MEGVGEVVVVVLTASFYLGNGGTASGLDRVSNIPISQDDFPALVHFAIDNGINLAVPGPEAPLVAGIEGYFRRGIHLASIRTPLLFS